MARTGLIYGESGTFKTTQIGAFARYIYKKTGKPIRLISADLGGYGPIKLEVDAGLVIPWRVSTIDNMLPVIRKLSKGYWPTVKEKDSALPDPNDPGKKLKVQYLDLASPTAKTWEEIGGYAVESLTSIGDAEMANLVATGRKVAEEIVSEWEETVMVDGQPIKEKFGAPARAHYNFVQNAIYSLINAFSSLPVEYVLFTALEAKSEEEDRTTIYGPSIAGKKATPKAPSWVGDCIHHDSYHVETIVPSFMPDGITPKMAPPDSPGAKPKQATEKVSQTFVRGYFMRHPDPKTQVNHPAKPRVIPNAWGKLLERWPGGFYTPVPGDITKEEFAHGFDWLLEEEDRLADMGHDGIMSWKEKVDAERAQSAKGMESSK
jgi:hypothetical protein